MDVTHKVDVLLVDKEHFRGIGDYDPDLPRHLAFTLLVEAESDLAACELAYAICNSYPPMEHDGVEYPAVLHCPVMYVPQVDGYRRAKNRSLSVGDLVFIGPPNESPGGKLYHCATIGFEEVTS